MSKAQQTIKNMNNRSLAKGVAKGALAVGGFFLFIFGAAIVMSIGDE